LRFARNAEDALADMARQMHTPQSRVGPCGVSGYLVATWLGLLCVPRRDRTTVVDRTVTVRTNHAKLM
jgi:hypothetical protein